MILLCIKRKDLLHFSLGQSYQEQRGGGVPPSDESNSTYASENWNEHEPTRLPDHLEAQTQISTSIARHMLIFQGLV